MTASYDLASATAVVLVGGLGTRLRPAVDDRPKALAPIAGRPFLSYLLDKLASSGLRHVVLCTGHRGEQIRTAYGESYDGLRLTYSQETTQLGTGGALRLAHDRIESSSLLVLNGDSFCDADLHDLWDWHHFRPSHVSVVAASVPDTSSFGRVETDAADRIVRFAEKTSSREPGRINAGIYLMHTALVGRIPANRLVSLEQDLFPRWVDAGSMFAYPTRAPFLDIGTPERFATAHSFLRSLDRVPDRAAIDEVADALATVQGRLA